MTFGVRRSWTPRIESEAASIQDRGFVEVKATQSPTLCSPSLDGAPCGQRVPRPPDVKLGSGTHARAKELKALAPFAVHGQPDDDGAEPLPSDRSRKELPKRVEIRRMEQYHRLLRLSLPIDRARMTERAKSRFAAVGPHT